MPIFQRDLLENAWRKPQIEIGGDIPRPVERERTTGTCRYVGTPEFAGPWRLDGRAQDSLWYTTCRGNIAVFKRTLSRVCVSTSVLVQWFCYQYDVPTV